MRSAKPPHLYMYTVMYSCDMVVRHTYSKQITSKWNSLGSGWLYTRMSKMISLKFSWDHTEISGRGVAWSHLRDSILQVGPCAPSLIIHCGPGACSHSTVQHTKDPPVSPGDCLPCCCLPLHSLPYTKWDTSSRINLPSGSATLN